MTSIRRAVLALSAAIGLGIAVAPGVASAHAILENSDPAPSSVLSTSPTQITLRFSETIEEQLNSVRLFDGEQDEVTIGKASRSASDQSVVTATLPQLKNGVYVAVWRVVSADGHPVTGAFPFEIGTSSSGRGQELLTDVLSNLDAQSNLGNPLAVARLLCFLGALVLIGLISVTWGSTLLATVRTVRIMQVAAMMLAIGSLGVLLLQGPFASGKSWGDIADAQLLNNVLQTRLGISALIRSAVALEWMFLSLFVAKVGANLWKNVSVFTAFVTLATFSFSGHPSAGDNAIVFSIVDIAHLGSVALWVGGLIALALFVASHDVLDEVRRFSRIATFAMPVAMATGIAQALNLLPSKDAITDTQYGKLLIAKVAVVMLAALIGVSLRRKLRLSEVPHVGRYLRREAALVVIVLALTSLMLGESPNESQAALRKNFSATLVQGGIVGDLQVLPARVGAAEVHTWFMPPGGMLEPVQSVKVAFSLPSRDIPNIPVDVVATGPNHWSGIIQFPYDGTWTMEVRVVAKDNKNLLYSTVVDISE